MKTNEIQIKSYENHNKSYEKHIKSYETIQNYIKPAPNIWIKLPSGGWSSEGGCHKLPQSLQPFMISPS